MFRKPPYVYEYQDNIICAIVKHGYMVCGRPSHFMRILMMYIKKNYKWIADFELMAIHQYGYTIHLVTKKLSHELRGP